LFFLFILAPNTKAANGSVDASYIQSGKLNAESRRSFPSKLIIIMKREAEDLLLGNSSDKNGRDALRFILSLVNNRKDMEHIKKGELLLKIAILVKWRS